MRRICGSRDTPDSSRNTIQARVFTAPFDARPLVRDPAGDLRLVPLERIVGEDQQEREHKLGAWIGNQRSRAAALTPERMEQLSAIGMRWA
ncbi:helicase associated domain-containing protein [Streptomyces toxytricini]|uniref:Helicase associated domain-containing protein n=1 Tax=Streptomyces toxytricini TaxID=67369 RepID=A0ABW8EVH9_STRT5